MSHTFKISVNQTDTFEFSENQAATLDAVKNYKDEFHVLHHNTSYKATIPSKDFNAKKYTVVVNNTTYEVEIADKLDQLIKEMGFEVGAAKLINAIKAPMPGLILEINVSVGQEVQQGENLLILEAMKMENSFDSPRSGIIKSIAVNKRQAVEKGQLLIEFE